MVDAVINPIKINCSSIFLQRLWASLKGDAVMKEIWKDIKGYEGCYQVSNLGRVKSLKREIKVKNHPNIKILKRKGKILMPSFTGYKKRYLGICLGRENRYLIHRLVAKAFILNPKNKPEINHKDGDPANNHIGNLEWCVPKENMQHAIKNGLFNVKGVYNPGVKLTEKQVKEIRSSFNIKQYKLAEKYKVCPATISYIINNKGWQHV